MKVLYAGDGTADGPARYLLGVMKAAKATVKHVLPSDRLTASRIRSDLDLIILSDMPANRVPVSAQSAIAARVADGTGLLMVGGWASFSGPFGGWRGSIVENLLPVRCLDRDDRHNFPGGALILPSREDHAIKGVPFDSPPAICGMNRIRPRPGARVVLQAHGIVSRRLSGGDRRLHLDSKPLPLLVVDGDPTRRIAAYASDFAPHWSGGLVDWGPRTRRIVVKGRIAIEVGSTYIQFVMTLLRRLARPKSSAFDTAAARMAGR